MKKIIFFLLYIGIHNGASSQCYQSLHTRGSHTLGITTDGTLWGWGRSSEGQLGSNFLWTQPLPIQVAGMTNVQQVFPGLMNTFVIKNDGTLWGIGFNEFNALGINSTAQNTTTFQQITTANNWEKVSASIRFTLALKTDGTIWAWGEDNQNQTGNPPSSASQNIPIQIGTATDWIDVATNTSRTAFALKADGTLWGWGNNPGSMLFSGSSVTSLSVPTQITTVSNWIKMSVGGPHILAQKSDGTLWSWGSGLGRGVGITSPTQGNIPHQIGTDTWKSFSAGEFQKSLGVKTDGTLWAWGSNTNGALGVGNDTNQPFPVQIGTDTNWDLVQAGRGATSMAIKTDGSIWYWSRNYYGEFGNGTDYDTNFYFTPQQTPNICVATLSSPNFEQKVAARLYPNPANGTVQLQYDLGIDRAAVVLYDITGRLLTQQTLSGAKGSTEINISNYAAGVYVVVVRNGSTLLYQQKLIIK
jgi:alpha-tubulin suppressor-like RCC1 family protein